TISNSRLRMLASILPPAPDPGPHWSGLFPNDTAETVAPGAGGVAAWGGDREVCLARRRGASGCRAATSCGSRPSPRNCCVLCTHNTHQNTSSEVLATCRQAERALMEPLAAARYAVAVRGSAVKPLIGSRGPAGGCAPSKSRETGRRARRAADRVARRR